MHHIIIVTVHEINRRHQPSFNRIGGVMVSVLTSSAVDREFESRSGLTKDYKIGICCFSAKHAALRRKSKDWLSRNQNNVSEWSDMSTRELLFHKRLVLSHSHLFLLFLTTHNHTNKNVSVKVMQIYLRSL
jgi:hypothetical protein